MARVCTNRDKILAYKAKHPEATVRQIQKACGVSSPSVVDHHLKSSAYEDYSFKDLKDENATLRKEVKRLKQKLARVERAMAT